MGPALSDREAETLLGALAGVPFPHLREGVRVRWRGPVSHDDGGDDGRVVGRTDDRIDVVWDGRPRRVLHRDLDYPGDRKWLECLEVLP